MREVVGSLPLLLLTSLLTVCRLKAEIKAAEQERKALQAREAELANKDKGALARRGTATRLGAAQWGWTGRAARCLRA